MRRSTRACLLLVMGLVLAIALQWQAMRTRENGTSGNAQSGNSNQLVTADPTGSRFISDSSATASSLPISDSVTQARVSEAVGKLPLIFEANQGQTDSQVKFLSRGSGYSLFLTSTEAVIQLRNPSAKSEIRNLKSSR